MSDERQTPNPNAQARDLKSRTKRYALRIIRLYATLPKTVEGQILGKQLLRSGTSVGAHYSEAFRARSTSEFISKIEVALQELEETIYWLELFMESGINVGQAAEEMKDIVSESNQLIRIFVSSVRTAKENR